MIFRVPASGGVLGEPTMPEHPEANNTSERMRRVNSDLQTLPRGAWSGLYARICLFHTPQATLSQPSSGQQLYSGTDSEQLQRTSHLSPPAAPPHGPYCIYFGLGFVAFPLGSKSLAVPPSEISQPARLSHQQLLMNLWKKCERLS